MEISKGLWRIAHISSILMALLVASQIAVIFFAFGRISFFSGWSIYAYVIAAITILACALIPYLCLAGYVWVAAGFREDDHDFK